MSEQDKHLLAAAESLRELLHDARVPEDVRAELMAEYAQVEAMMAKLSRGDIHIAAFGRVSVGKSSLLNALVGEQAFATSPLHGETRHSQVREWQHDSGAGVHLIDTPGINELDGEAREAMAFDVASRSDLILFVVDGDMTASELKALRAVTGHGTPVMLVLNKADRYTGAEVEALLQTLRARAEGLVHPDNVVQASADPRPVRVITQSADGRELESERARDVDVATLNERIVEILEREGKTLAALNAMRFAGQLSDEVARRIADVRRQLAERITRTYCVAKGVAVALNPVPVADLLAAASLDVVLVRHLSQVYGLPMTRAESGRLIATIVAQLAALMGAIWGVHLVSSALKGLSAGASIAVTALAQGALAYYATYLVGRAAERYLVNGKSWGERGPKRVMREILDSVDRRSILAEAREDIARRLRQSD